MSREKVPTMIEEITCDGCGCDINSEENNMGDFFITAYNNGNVGFESTQDGDYCKTCCDKISSYFNKLMKAGGFMERYEGRNSVDSISYMIDLIDKDYDIRVEEA